MTKACVIASDDPSACRKMIPIAGNGSSKLILTFRPVV